MNVKYIIIPSSLLFDSRISSFAKLLYGELSVLSYKNGFCEVSNAFLSTANNCSESKIIRALMVLKKYGYIEVKNCSHRKIKVVQK